MDEVTNKTPISYIRRQEFFVEVSFEENRTNYPKLKKLNANSYYLGLIQNLYSASEGELPSFLQTFFQATITQSTPKLHALLKKISEQDKKHMEILADAIIKLGGTPKFFNAQSKWFTTREIDYVQGIKQIISYDIEMKEKMVLDYKSTIQKVSSPELKAFLQRILDDEINHLEQLKNIYAGL